MSKEYLVIRGGRVVYTPGHYDEASARATAITELKAHPGATVYIVKKVAAVTRRAPGTAVKRRDLAKDPP